MTLPYRLQRSVCTIIFKSRKLLLQPYYSQGNWIVKRLNKCCSGLSKKSAQSSNKEEIPWIPWNSLAWTPNLSTLTAEHLLGLYISRAANCPQTSGARSSCCGWKRLQRSSMLVPSSVPEFVNMLRTFQALESPAYTFMVCCLHWNLQVLETHDTIAPRKTCCWHSPCARNACFSEAVTFLPWNVCEIMICYKCSILLKDCPTFPCLQPEICQAKYTWICLIKSVLLYFLSLPGLIPSVPHCHQTIKLLHPVKWTLHNKYSFHVHVHHGTLCQALICIKDAPNLNFSREIITRYKILIKLCIWI